jgi:hypothetical protein
MPLDLYEWSRKEENTFFYHFDLSLYVYLKLTLILSNKITRTFMYYQVRP